MHLLDDFTGSHGIEQTIGHQRQHVLIQQSVNQPCTAFSMGAAFDHVIDETLAIAEIQLSTIQALAQKTKFDFHELA